MTAPRARRRRPAELSDECGLSLIESVVALSLAVALLLVVGMELVHAMHDSMLSRQNSQAADLLMQQVENARSTPYASLAMAGSDLSGDGRINTTVAPATASIGAAGTTEQVYTASGAAIAPHVSTISRSTGTYTVKRYVTTPSGCTCRRFSAMVSWTQDGVTHRRWTSTIVTDSTYGALVDWTWTLPFGSAGSATKSSPAAVAALLLNNGERGQWQLTATVTNSSGVAQGWSQGWYSDANGDGLWQSASDKPQLDMATAGTGLTGTVESGTSERPLLVLSVPSGAVAGTYTVRLTATPVGGGAAKTATYSLAVS